MKNWVLGNWKMNQNLNEVDSFLSSLDGFKIADNIVAGIAPQAIHIQKSNQSNITNLKIGSQNCYFEDKGAFTGESSSVFLKEVGCDFILIGHSERRAIFSEDNELLAKKLNHVLSNDLLAVFCIGETLEQREGSKTFSIIKPRVI